METLQLYLTELPNAIDVNDENDAQAILVELYSIKITPTESRHHPKLDEEPMKVMISLLS